jgi:plastocyanin
MNTTDRHMMGLALLFTMLACGGSGGGGGGNPTEPDDLPTAITVTTGSQLPPRFIPTATALAVGGTVTWRNGSPVPHNVISKTDAWPASTDLAPAETFQVTFPQAGDFGYRCSIHPGMEGTITVR